MFEIELNDTADIARSASYICPQLENDSYVVKAGERRNITTKEMLLIFPLWTFHLYVATFRQHLHMEYIYIYIYIYISWFGIPQLLVPIICSCKRGSYWILAFLVWVHRFDSFTVVIMHSSTVVEYICVIDYRVYNKSSTSNITSGARTAIYPSWAPRFIPGF